jgi:glycosyltransferase involved in cell wall biosynthesis
MSSSLNGTRLLLLSRYGPRGASSRVRLFAYERWLVNQGFSLEIQALLSDDYLSRLYAGGGRRAVDISAAYWYRLGSLLRGRRPGIIWLEKELFPYIPAWFESLLLANVPYVVDIDDAIFHDYDQHHSALVRRVLGKKIDRLFQKAALVTAGNSYLLARANEAGAKWAELLPTVVDIDDYPFAAREPGNGFTVGWIGSPATQGYVRSMEPVLSELLDGECNRLVTIGTNYPQKLFKRHEQHEWSSATEARQLSQLDVGIMPLPDEPFERGKCGYKLIQYMAAGLPVVASPVGVNKEIVRHGENGFLAETAAEWRNALALLKQDPLLRRRMGVAGREAVQRHYCLQVTGPKMADRLAAIATGHTAPTAVH